MLVLAIDTCDAKGSAAILRDDEVVETIVHRAGEGYSSWLLPTVDQLLGVAGAKLADVELFAVATGPGSFTGVRIGLTTAKAWGEVFGRPIAAMSRLEVLAGQGRSNARFVASFIDAQRGQVFGAVYKGDRVELALCRDEAVSGGADFLAEVLGETGSAAVEWVTTDEAVMESLIEWRERAPRARNILEVSPVLAPLIGKLGLQKALRGQVQDALSLDANYVRRSYVEAAAKPAHEG